MSPKGTPPPLPLSPVDRLSALEKRALEGGGAERVSASTAPAS
jgi:hypothetical protein